MKMKISWLRIAAVALLALVLCCGAAMAETYGAFVYKVNDDQTVSITAYTEAAETITVPGEIDGMPVVSVSFKSSETHSLLYKSLTEVTLPQSVVRLEDLAFADLGSLSAVHGLDNLEYAGTLAFANTALEEAVFGPQLTFLGSQALLYTKVTKVVLPDNVWLYSSAFQGTFYLQEIGLLPTENPQYKVSDGALYSCDMTELVAVCSAGRSTFVVPDSVTTIKTEAFSVDPSEKYGVQDVYIGANVTTVEPYAFRDFHDGELPVLHVAEDSAAHQYALAYGRAFILIGADNDVSLQQRIDEVIAACITSGMSEYQKARALHDWICDNVVYDDALTLYSAKSALIDGVAVCEGYTNAYSMLLDEVGIENYTIPNILIDHVWNLAKLDGVWTYIDCTWDDSLGSDDYFCFNSDICYTTHGGLRNTVWGDADSLSLYQPYTGGRYQTSVEAAYAAVRENIAAGTMNFTFSCLTQIEAGVMMTTLRESSWTVGGKTWQVSVQGAADSCDVDCIAYESDGSFVDAAGDFEIETVPAGICITKYTGSDRSVTISSELLGYPVVSIGDNAFRDNETIREITIPGSVRSIGFGAFSGCIFLQNVHLNEGLEEIGGCAFFNCPSLEKITLPASLTLLDEGVFSSTRLTEVVLPAGITSIPMQCFQYTPLEKLEARGRITSIGAYAFLGCDMTSFTIPDTVTRIDEGAFQDCTMLESITVPAGVTAIGRFVFQGCDALKELVCKAPASVMIYQDGVIYRDNGATLDTVLPWVKTLNVPDTVTAIDTWAAFGNSGLTAVTMGDQVKTVGEYAFGECVNLTSIRFSDSITEFPSGVLSMCHKLTRLHLPAGLTKISQSSIMVNVPFLTLPDVELLPRWGVTGVDDTKRVIISDTVTTVQEQAIVTHRRGAEVWAPDSVVNITNGWLWQETAPVVVCNPGSAVWQWAQSAGMPCIAYPVLSADSLSLAAGETAELTIDFEGLMEFGTLQYISDNPVVATVEQGIVRAVAPGETQIRVTVENVELVCRVTVGEAKRNQLPLALTVIEAEAFAGSGFTEVVLPAGVTTIGSRAFANCMSLTTVEIPASVTVIANDAFEGCSGLTIVCSSGSKAEAYAAEKGFSVSIR